MKFNKTIASMAAAAALLAASVSAQAATFQARISDGINSLLVIDNGVGDIDATVGSIGFAGVNVFGDWQLNFVTGASVYDPLQMHLNAQFTANSSAFEVGDSRILTVELTQTGLSSGPGSSNVSVYAYGGGSAIGSNVVGSWAAFADDADADAAAAFGTGVAVHTSSGFESTAGGVSTPLTGLYSGTLRAVFDVSGSSGLSSGSLDLSMKVPEPGTIALAGLALLGLGVARRRKA